MITGSLEEYAKLALALAQDPERLMRVRATLGRNRAILREIAAKNPRARVQELAGHDHFALRPGERAASPELMSTLIGWLHEAVR